VTAQLFTVRSQSLKADDDANSIWLGLLSLVSRAPSVTFPERAERLECLSAERTGSALERRLNLAARGPRLRSMSSPCHGRQQRSRRVARPAKLATAAVRVDRPSRPLTVYLMPPVDNLSIRSTARRRDLPIAASGATPTVHGRRTDRVQTLHQHRTHQRLFISQVRCALERTLMPQGRRGRVAHLPARPAPARSRPSRRPGNPLVQAGSPWHSLPQLRPQGLLPAARTTATAIRPRDAAGVLSRLSTSASGALCAV